MKNLVIFIFCALFLLAVSTSSEAQVINQNPLSPFGGSINSLVAAVNSYNAYITSGAPLTGALSSSAAAMSLTQNQRNLDGAIARIANTQFHSVAYNSVAGVPLYVGNQEQINQLINAISPNAAAYQDVLNQLGPGIYTTLPTFLFNSANLQNIQLQERLGSVRASNAYAATESDPGNKKIVAPTKNPLLSNDSEEGKITTFIDGNGMWSQAQSVNTLPSYNTYAGGVQAGATYHLIPGIDVGPYVGYQGTRATYQDAGGSTIVDNSLRYGLFGTYTHDAFYIDGIAGGAYNAATINRRIKFSNSNTDPYSQMGFGPGTSINSTATGNVAGGEFDSLLGSGYNFKFHDLKFGPAGSVQYSYLGLGSTQESGAGVENLNVGTQNASSLLTTLGGQVSYDYTFHHSMLLRPYGGLAWQHEFLQNSYTLGSSIMGQNFNYVTTNPGRDQYIATLGANLIITKSISLFAVCNLTNSDSKVFSQSVFGGCNYKF